MGEMLNNFKKQIISVCTKLMINGKFERSSRIEGC
jgi:hypothetical protein